MTWRGLYHGGLEGCEWGKRRSVWSALYLMRIHLINFEGSLIMGDVPFTFQKKKSVPYIDV